MNILTATDNNYAPWCGVMLTSLLKYNTMCDIHIWILGDELSDSNKVKFQRLHKNLNIIDVDWNLFKGSIPSLTTMDYLSRTTWARLGVAKLLPLEIDKILYIDADTLVMGQLSELYDEDLTDFAAAAVDEYRDARYIDIPGFYFNAGVILINVDYFRRNDILNQCIEYVKKNSSLLRFHDQDVLNKVLEGHVKFMHRKFNMTCCGDVESDDLRPGEKFIQDKEAIYNNDVRIYHYVGMVKPWQLYHFRPRPFDRCWRQIYRHSLWKNCKLKMAVVSYKSKTIVLLINFLIKIGIKKQTIYQYWTDVYPNTRWNRIKSFFSLDSYR